MEKALGDLRRSILKMLLASSEKPVFEGDKVILVADLKILKHLQPRMHDVAEYFDCSTVELWMGDTLIDTLLIPEKALAFKQKNYPKAS